MTSKSAYVCHKQNVGLGGQGNEQNNFNQTAKWGNGCK